jgi:hypothetical protein
MNPKKWTKDPTKWIQKNGFEIQRNGFSKPVPKSSEASGRADGAGLRVGMGFDLFDDM